MSTVAEKVRAAADYIDRTGLHKGSMVGWPLTVYENRDEILERGVPCCTIGALSVFEANIDEVRIPLAKRLGVYYAYEAEWAGEKEFVETDNIPDWNDAPERTKEDVVTALREFADELEATDA